MESASLKTDISNLAIEN